MAGVRRWLLVAGVVGLFGIAACGPAARPPSASSLPPSSAATTGSRASSAPASQAATGRIWILAASHFDQVVGTAAVQALFRQGTVFEPIGPHESPDPNLPVVSTAVFHSYAALMQAIATHAISPSVRAILYDNQRSPATPATEQAHPLRYATLVAQVARQHHWISICDAIPPGRLPASDRQPAHEVPPCTIIGLNTVQESERQASAYAQAVQRWVATIRRVRPRVPIVAGISANPRGAPVTATMLRQAMVAVDSAVNGFWLNVPAPGISCPHCQAPDPQVLAEALQQFAQQGRSPQPGRHQADPANVGTAFRRGGWHWMMAASALRRLPPSLQQRLWQDPAVWVVVGAKTVIPPGARARLLLDATSLEGVRQALVQARRRPSWGILLDVEDWPLTPAAQQADPVATYRIAARWIHAAGLHLVASPALDLFQGHASPAAAMLQSHCYAQLAAFADVVEIQAQGLELSPTAYTTFVKAAVAEMDAGGRHPLVIAGLSTNPGVGVPTSAVLETDMDQIRGLVGGIWLNVPQPGRRCPRCHLPQPQIATAVLSWAFSRQNE